jgi:hypothetical protein
MCEPFATRIDGSGAITRITTADHIGILSG